MEPQVPAPAAPEAPAPAVAITPPGDASVAPAPVVQPTADPVVPPPVKTAEETAQEAEDSEWDTAADEIFPGLRSRNKGGKPDEQPKPKEGTEEAPEVSTDPQGEKPDAGTGNGDDPAKPSDGTAADGAESGDDEEAQEEPDTFARDTRLAARESARQLQQTVTDVRSKMFADAPTTLQDADGDPITKIEDVMKLQNPRTGEAFTETDAATWLLAAQQQFNQSLADRDKQIESIAQTNVDLKDEADSINYRYGALLKEMPEVKDQVWKAFEKTLVKDDKSGVITSAPVSLEEFYDLALKPYADIARQLSAKTEADTQAQATAAATAQQEAEQQRVRTRQDRSDIYGPAPQAAGATAAEDKEWDEAATAVFGPRKK